MTNDFYRPFEIHAIFDIILFSIEMILICAFTILLPNLMFTATKKFSNGFEIKFGLDGKDFYHMVFVTLIGAFGLVPTGLTGRCKNKFA